MIKAFLQTLLPNPNAKTPLRKLYNRFKMLPKTEGIRYPFFLSRLAATRLPVEKQCLVGFALPPEPASLLVIPGKTERTDAIKLCQRCGGHVHPCYGQSGSVFCEDCLAEMWTTDDTK